MLMGASDSDSRNSKDAMIVAAIRSSTGPNTAIILSFNNLENRSVVCVAPASCSVTNGTGRNEDG